MEPEEFDRRLRESGFLRGALADLLNAWEQTSSIIAAAIARRVDAADLAADLLSLQQEAALDDPNPVRDRLLKALRDNLARAGRIDRSGPAA